MNTPLLKRGNNKDSEAASMYKLRGQLGQFLNGPTCKRHKIRTGLSILSINHIHTEKSRVNVYLYADAIHYCTLLQQIDFIGFL